MSRRAGAIFAHCGVTPSSFGSPNFSARALHWAKITASDVRVQRQDSA
ncbi:hypothetical protein HMPREF3212_02762 [Citrobacter freundii]|nr:hypothetical protein HMPREF3212_02762 [Citrobacter freundii]